MASITKEQADTIIALLTDIRNTTAASAVVAEALLAEKQRPRLEREHLQIQQDAWLQQSTCEAEQRAKHAELERAKAPRLWASGIGIATVREDAPAALDAESDDRGET
jgi:hypothetical protein